MGWERARTKDQKQQRIADIVNATARLYAKHSFEEITFTAIASEAEFTRSNLYKYFNSKEEIFFEFLKHDVRLWRKDLFETIDTDKVYPVKAFADIWVTVMNRHERMLNLISILYAYLEKNASIERMIDFKSLARDEYSRLCELLCCLFPALGMEKAIKFLNLQLAASIGLYTMTHLSEAQKKVLDYPEFTHLKVDYTPYFTELVTYLLQGLMDPS